MSQVKMEAARELIKEKHYDAARAVLLTIDDPRAREWLAKLDQISPPQLEKEIPEKPNRTLVILGMVVVGITILGLLVYSQRNNIPAVAALFASATPTPTSTPTLTPTITPTATDIPTSTPTPFATAQPGTGTLQNPIPLGTVARATFKGQPIEITITDVYSGTEAENKLNTAKLSTLHEKFNNPFVYLIHIDVNYPQNDSGTTLRITDMNFAFYSNSSIFGASSEFASALRGSTPLGTWLAYDMNPGQKMDGWLIFPVEFMQVRNPVLIFAEGYPAMTGDEGRTYFDLS